MYKLALRLKIICDKRLAHTIKIGFRYVPIVIEAHTEKTYSVR